MEKRTNRLAIAIFSAVAICILLILLVAVFLPFGNPNWKDNIKIGFNWVTEVNPETHEATLWHEESILKCEDNVCFYTTILPKWCRNYYPRAKLVWVTSDNYCMWFYVMLASDERQGDSD